MVVIDDSERASTGPWIGTTVDMTGAVAVRRPKEIEISMSWEVARCFVAGNGAEGDDKQRVPSAVGGLLRYELGRY
jgi:hypothetical protein